MGRGQGHSEIERRFKKIFDADPPRTGRAPTPIPPQDLLVIQELDGHAVVTFQLGSETARQRRTFVLKRIGDPGPAKPTSSVQRFLPSAVIPYFALRRGDRYAVCMSALLGAHNRDAGLPGFGDGAADARSIRPVLYGK
jgi:hypothetical protein